MSTPSRLPARRRPQGFGARSLPILALLVAGALTALASDTGQDGAEEPHLELSPGVLFAHALGGIGGVVYTNSREAFDWWYRRGRRHFETDLVLTTDRQLVCFHPGLEPLLGLHDAVERMTLAQFLRARPGGLGPLSFRELLQLMRDGAGTHLLVDSTGLTPVFVEELQRAIDGVDPMLRRRLLVSFAHPQELPVLRQSEARHGPFAAIACAPYRWNPSPHELLDFVRSHNVPVVVLGTYAASRALIEALHSSGARVLLHTVNDPVEARQWLAAGADGLVTDFLDSDLRAIPPAGASAGAESEREGGSE